MKKKVEQAIEWINKYAGGLAVIIPVFIGISTGIIKYFLFCRASGYLSYFNYSSDIVDVFNENILMSMISSALVIFSLIIALLFIYTPLSMWKKGSRWACIWMTIICAFLVFLFYSMLFSSEYPGMVILGFTLITLIYAILIKILPLLTSKKATKASKHTNQGKSDKGNKLFEDIIILIIGLVICIAVVSRSYYSMGKSDATDMKEFKIVTDNRVVIYETAQKYYVSKCEVNEDHVVIYTNIQAEISKEDIETKSIIFEQIEVQ